MDKHYIKEQIREKKERLKAYRDKEREILAGGVQSYGIGSRNLTRYNVDLSTIREAIKELEAEIAALEAQAAGKKPRKAVGVIPRDW
ncbi:MAG TPA: hypothetical protein IAC67_03800 [Candidatus Coproplasma excrementipullorum]|nr:hypothetical protein [Candidatus Coproplasma excrementipullorum]